MFPKEYDDILNMILEIPGVSKKQASKIFDFLYQKYQSNSNEISHFESLMKKIKKCSICKLYSIEQLCNICNSKTRESKLIIVEEPSQIEKYEKWNIFNGKYYVINSLFNKKLEINLNNINLSFFLNYIDKFDEIIIAISPTPEGILSTNFIFDTIKKERPNKLVTKLAIGVPIGSSIDYVDQLTFSYAVKNRKEIKD